MITLTEDKMFYFIEHYSMSKKKVKYIEKVIFIIHKFLILFYEKVFINFISFFVLKCLYKIVVIRIALILKSLYLNFQFI